MPQGNHSRYPVAKLLLEMFIFFFFILSDHGKLLQFLLCVCVCVCVIKRTHFKGFHVVACDAKVHYMFF